MLPEVDALLLTLSCQIQKVPGKANIGSASLLLSYLPPSGDPEHSGVGTGRGIQDSDDGALELRAACTA